MPLRRATKLTLLIALAATAIAMALLPGLTTLSVPAAATAPLDAAVAMAPSAP